jgi:hypothetical protein
MSTLSISSIRAIATLIPNDTPRPVLLHLRQRYGDLTDVVPTWYRNAVLARLNALLERHQEAA